MESIPSVHATHLQVPQRSKQSVSSPVCPPPSSSEDLRAQRLNEPTPLCSLTQSPLHHDSILMKLVTKATKTHNSFALFSLCRRTKGDGFRCTSYMTKSIWMLHASHVVLCAYSCHCIPLKLLSYLRNQRFQICLQEAETNKVHTFVHTVNV